MELNTEMFKTLAGMNGHDEPKTPKLSDFDNLQITDSTLIPVPIPIISISGEIISPEGTITTISGASKSGKSAFTGILLAGAISPDGKIDGLEGVVVQPNIDRKAVLHFDTEQARYKHQKNLKSILKRCSMQVCPDYFRSYNIRGLDLDQYSTTTSDICKAAFHEHGGIHLIVIDGGADYISDVNDPMQSNQIIKFFEDLATCYHTAVVIIIHTNPGSDKERGHLGSHFQRKSDSVIKIKTEGDISYLDSGTALLRNAGKGNINQIQFMYDKEKGYHVGCGIKSSDQATKDAERIELIKKVSIKVFSGQISLKYGEAIEAIMRESKKGETKAKEYFKEMKAQQMIMQGEDEHWRISSTI